MGELDEDNTKFLFRLRKNAYIIMEHLAFYKMNKSVVKKNLAIHQDATKTHGKRIQNYREKYSG